MTNRLAIPFTVPSWVLLIFSGLGVGVCWWVAQSPLPESVGRYFAVPLWIGHSFTFGIVVCLCWEVLNLGVWKTQISSEFSGALSWLDEEVDYAREYTLEAGEVANPTEIASSVLRLSRISADELDRHWLRYVLLAFVISVCGYGWFCWELATAFPSGIESANSAWNLISPILYVSLVEFAALLVMIVVLSLWAKRIFTIRENRIIAYLANKYQVDKLPFDRRKSKLPTSHPLQTPTPPKSPVPQQPLSGPPSPFGGAGAPSVESPFGAPPTTTGSAPFQTSSTPPTSTPPTLTPPSPFGASAESNSETPPTPPGAQAPLGGTPTSPFGSPSPNEVNSPFAQPSSSEPKSDQDATPNPPSPQVPSRRRRRKS